MREIRNEGTQLLCQAQERPESGDIDRTWEVRNSLIFLVVRSDTNIRDNVASKFNAVVNLKFLFRDCNIEIPAAIHDYPDSLSKSGDVFGPNQGVVDNLFAPWEA